MLSNRRSLCFNVYANIIWCLTSKIAFHMSRFYPDKFSVILIADIATQMSMFTFRCSFCQCNSVFRKFKFSLTCFPSIPVGPGGPGIPGSPFGPCKPSGPGGPGIPSPPLLPRGPGSPGAPAGPSGPVWIADLSKTVFLTPGTPNLYITFRRFDPNIVLFHLSSTCHKFGPSNSV